MFNKHHNTSKSRKNFTEREKYLLLNIIEKYKSIVANKNTNAQTVAKKKWAWEKIVNEYNSTGPEIPRTAKQLNTAWVNFKRIASQKKNGSQFYSGVPIKFIKIAPKVEDGEDNKMVANNFANVEVKLESVNEDTSLKEPDDDCPIDSNAIDNHPVEIEVLCDVDPSKTLTQQDTIPEQDITPEIKKHIHMNTSNNNLRRTSISDLQKHLYLKKLESASIDKKTKLIQYKIALQQKSISEIELRIKKLEYKKLLKKN